MRNGRPRTATSTFTQLLRFVLPCCFTSTETVRTIRDGEPRTATSTFPQLLRFVLPCCFTSTETVRTIRDGEPRTATSTFPELSSSVLQCCFAETVRRIRDGEPRTATSTFTQLLNSDTWCMHPVCPLTLADVGLQCGHLNPPTDIATVHVRLRYGHFSNASVELWRGHFHPVIPVVK